MLTRRSRNRAIGALALSVLAACASPAPQAPPAPLEPTTIEATGTWRHEDSGLEFPERVGSFSRVSIARFDAAGTDVGVGYNHLVAGTLVVLTVYVYPPHTLDSGELVTPTQLFEYEKEGIRASHEQVTESWSRLVTFVCDQSSIPGSAAEFRYSEQFAYDTHPVVSQLYLFQSDGRFVKYRISFPASRENAARPVVDALLASAPWGRVVSQ